MQGECGLKMNERKKPEDKGYKHQTALEDWYRIVGSWILLVKSVVESNKENRVNPHY